MSAGSEMVIPADKAVRNSRRTFMFMKRFNHGWDRMNADETSTPQSANTLRCLWTREGGAAADERPNHAENQLCQSRNRTMRNETSIQNQELTPLGVSFYRQAFTTMEAWENLSHDTINAPTAIHRVDPH